jgi:hypothetical protein
MPSWGILVGAIAACWLGQYKIAFWMTVFNVVSGGVMVAAIVRDPSWHAARRAGYALLLAADDDDEEEITALVMTKVVFIAASAVLCWYFGKWAGYF